MGRSTYTSKSDIRPDDGWRNPMQDLMFAALAALSLSAAALPAACTYSTIARDTLAKRARRTR
jgi:hypothetical protein